MNINHYLQQIINIDKKAQERIVKNKEEIEGKELEALHKLEEEEKHIIEQTKNELQQEYDKKIKEAQDESEALISEAILKCNQKEAEYYALKEKLLNQVIEEFF